MPSPFFTPWIGRLYGGRGSILPKRVMVVGASHYCGNGCRDCGNAKAHPECAVFTQDVVRDYLSDDYSGDWKKTFTTFINSVFGRATSMEERARFMDSIVFMNFLQRAEGCDADEKHDEYFNAPANIEAFKATIRECRPDVVVTWGSRVWNAIPWDLGCGKAEKVAHDIFRYSFDGRSFLLVGLHHPSIGYPSDASHNLLARVGAAAEESSFIAEYSEFAPDRRGLVLKSRPNGACAWLHKNIHRAVAMLAPEPWQPVHYIR